MELPEEYVNVLITYKGDVRVNGYGDREKRVVTRRAFYGKTDGYYDNSNNWIDTPEGTFSVPQFWQKFTFSDGTSALLPHTFYSYGRVLPKDIISWELDTSNEE